MTDWWSNSTRLDPQFRRGHVLEYGPDTPTVTSLSSSNSSLTPRELVVETPQPPLRHSEMGTTPYTYANMMGTPKPADTTHHDGQTIKHHGELLIIFSYGICTAPTYSAARSCLCCCCGKLALTHQQQDRQEWEKQEPRPSLHQLSADFACACSSSRTLRESEVVETNVTGRIISFLFARLAQAESRASEFIME